MSNLNYGVVGNCRTAALISEKGSIDWLCFPDFDSPSIFASLLDRERGGSFGFDVTEDYHISQSYVPHTNILSTSFSSKEGEFVVEVRTFTQRGVADLYDLYQADSAFMKGAAIADKVIGKGAAALMVLGGFKTVYADIISTPALALLCKAGIETTFAQEVPHIINRDKTGWCPLETACMELNTVEEMYPVIQNFISRIRAK